MKRTSISARSIMGMSAAGFLFLIVAAEISSAESPFAPKTRVTVTSQDQSAAEPAGQLIRPGVLGQLAAKVRDFFAGLRRPRTPQGLSPVDDIRDLSLDDVIDRIKRFRFSLSTGMAVYDEHASNSKALYHLPFPQDNPLLGNTDTSPSRALSGTGADGKPGLTQFDVAGPTLDPENPTRLAVDENGYYPGGVELPSNIFSPRRQTDQMVRQMQMLLPPDTRRDAAFLNPDRVLQNPEQALRDLQGKQFVVIHGSFMGMGSDASFGAAGGDVPAGPRMLHQKQLEALNLTLALARAKGLEIRDVFYAVGDTNVSTEQHQKALFDYLGQQLKPRLDALLGRYGVSPKQDSIPFGADETAAIAMARLVTALRPMTASLQLEGADKQQKYDAYQPTAELAHKSLGLLGLKVVDGEADLNILAAAENGAETRQALQALSPEQLATTVVIDSRRENGALDGTLAPSRQALGYSAWGTFNNAFGQGVAQAIIVSDFLKRAEEQAESRNDPRILAAARAQVAELTLQAVAHDAFVTGYRDGGNADDSDLQRKVREAVGIDWNQERYMPVAELPAFAAVVTEHVNARLQEKFGSGTPRVVMLPQFNRTFEMVPVTEGTMGRVIGHIDRQLIERIAREQPHLFTPGLRRTLGL